MGLSNLNKIIHVFYSKIHITDEEQINFETELLKDYQLENMSKFKFSIVFFNLCEIDFLRKSDKIPDFIILYELNTYKNLKKIVKIKQFYQETNYELITINNPYSRLVIKGSLVIK